MAKKSEKPKPPRARGRKDDPARTRPLTLEFLRELGAFKDFSAPKGKFDPSGAWTQTYRLWLVQRWRGGGCLRLGRKRLTGGGVGLDVDLTVVEHTGYSRRVTASLKCVGDALCTPRSWTLQSRNIGGDDRPTTGTAFSETGAIRDGRLEIRFGDKVRTEKVPEPITSNFSLFEAVGRLAGKKAKPLKFAMLEGLDMLKPGQRLEYRRDKVFDLGGSRLRLRGYHQIGEGVLPWQYWVDQAGRLLFAFSGLRAFIYDPNAERWMQEKLRAARGAGGRRRPTK